MVSERVGVNKTLAMLLELQELELLRRSRLAWANDDGASVKALEVRMQRLRRQVPGIVLSEYDRLARDVSDAIAVLDGHCCQGCLQPVPARALREILHERKTMQCHSCQRFLIPLQGQSDYVALG